MTQEIGKLEGNGCPVDYTQYPLGSRMFLFPHHVSGFTSTFLVNISTGLHPLNVFLLRIKTVCALREKVTF